MRAKWHSDDPDAFAAQVEWRSSWRRATRGGVVACGVVAGGASYLDRVPLAMDTPVFRVPLIQVTSLEYLQLVSTRPALHRLLMIFKAYEVVANIWVSIPCVLTRSSAPRSVTLP